METFGAKIQVGVGNVLETYKNTWLALHKFKSTMTCNRPYQYQSDIQCDIQYVLLNNDFFYFALCHLLDTQK